MLPTILTIGFCLLVILTLFKREKSAADYGIYFSFCLFIIARALFALAS